MIPENWWLEDEGSSTYLTCHPKLKFSPDYHIDPIHIDPNFLWIRPYLSPSFPAVCLLMSGKLPPKYLGWNLGSDAVGLAWFGDQCVSWFSWDRGCYQVVYRRLFQAIRRTLSKPTAWNQKDSQEGERTPCMFLGSVFLLGDVCHPMLYNANRSVWSKVWYHQERLLRLREARASSQWFSRREKNINTINYSIN